MGSSNSLNNLKSVLNLKFFLNYPKTKLLIDKLTKKILYSSEDISKDTERFLKHLVKVDKDMLDVIFDGWNVISGKYPISPISYCGIVGEEITFMFNDTFAVIIDTPSRLINFKSEVLNKSLDELLLLDYVEAVGLDGGDDYSTYKGCLTDYEERILHSIINAENKTTSLLVDMLALLIPLKWEPKLGWFIVGEQYSIVSTYKNWLLMETEGLLKNFT